jgi:hypothetical protein
MHRVGGVHADLMASQMVIFLAFMDLPTGQMFTIGTFTWTTSMDGAVKVMEVV